jgi:Malectin domain
VPRTRSRSVRAAALATVAAASLLCTALLSTAAVSTATARVTVAGPTAGAEPTFDHIVSAAPAGFTPNVNEGRVEAMAQVGKRIIAVGNFATVTAAASAGGETYDRRGIFAFNAKTGVIDTAFTPDVGGARVADIVAAGDGTVYLGGDFASVNGAANTGKVARIDAKTGAVVARFRAPAIKGPVSGLRLANDRLYIGGGFTAVAGKPRTLLAALSPTTGADTGSVDFSFAGPWHGGSIGIKRFDISDNGKLLVAVGNFRTVDGQPRAQIMKANLGGRTAQLSGWSTEGFTTPCADSFQTYLRDVDIAAGGRYFVVATTGAFSGGVESGTLCDTVSRWKLAPAAAAQKPTWVDYTGGDTATRVKAAGAAIYLGGHFRWLNNPYAGDSAGDGAVARTGIAAIDPRNGLPFSWDPTRARGYGVWDFLTTSAGLWVGHDTNRIGRELHKRIALFPSDGGTALPTENTGALPGDVYLLGRPAHDQSAHWVARVNAGGPTLLATDNGPDWASDTEAEPSGQHNAGSQAADWGDLPIGIGPGVAPTTPASLFQTERSTTADTDDLLWDFPAPEGHHLTVRLFFSNGCDCTSSLGQRKFDVSVDGDTKVDNFDIVLWVGNHNATMQSYDIVSDGNVDIDLSHEIGNPLINGIEIIDDDVSASSPSADHLAVGRRFTGTTVKSTRTLTDPVDDWSSLRGAVMIDRTLYTATSNGALTARAFDGTTFGAPSAVDLHGLRQFSWEIPNITGMFYAKATGRLYYTLAGQPRLYYRYFEPESQTVGAVEFAGPGNASGIDWSAASGMLLYADTLYVGSATTGNLARVGWKGGQPTGTATVVSGPAIDSEDWRARALFAYAG